MNAPRANAQQACKELTQQFYDKFGVYPVIRRRRAIGEFTLEKISLANTIPYYKLGERATMAQWLINNLKYIPHAALTFETMEEVREFKREQKKNSRREKDEQTN
jgi:hypothetical protein